MNTSVLERKCREGPLSSANRLFSSPGQKSKARTVGQRGPGQPRAKLFTRLSKNKKGKWAYSTTLFGY